MLQSLFYTKPPEQRTNDKEYPDVNPIVNGMSVVNDVAERYSKQCNNFLTFSRNKDMFQDIENCRKDAKPQK